MLNSQSFFNQLAQFAERRAVVEGELSLSFTELLQLCDDFKHELNQQMPDKRQLVFLKAHNSISSIVAYLSCLQAGHPVMLLDPVIVQDSLANLVCQYQPNVLIDSLNIERLHQRELELDPYLALLLSTSGSTGSAKQVCL
ncbi:MAG: hypothetical protein NWQ54_09400, partial [Paraglaciecola sp.]|nr:hypothetical protein [Paraglaciecola sp.]